ncbi:MAG: glycosyltransferase [Caulobacteraceae bacterium]
MRVAIIHYWLVTMRGGERVLERICDLYPQADIFTHVYDPGAVSDRLRRRNIQTTFIQNLPDARRRYRSYLPLMPMALEQLDLSGYDLVISSEAGPAKGIIPAPDATHVCYCHSPMRYIWDQFSVYRKSANMVTRAAMPWIAHSLRTWDVASSARVDRFLANSNFVGRRIEKYYRREFDVVNPPVPVSRFSPSRDVGSEFLWVGQLVPYKRPELAIDAFNANGLPLRIVGDGPMAKRLQAQAGPNIRFESHLSLSELAHAYARCRALVFTAEEDFGIVPVEVNASGRPVIALGRGGVLETLLRDVTAVFYEEASREALIDAVERFVGWEKGFNPRMAVMNAQRFSPEIFDANFLASVERAIGPSLPPPALPMTPQLSLASARSGALAALT